ncbi:MAG: aminopeptidase [Lachnospiraceae bacterium]|nr:aminopeptidase [Lachnospiraceae bacterium]
MDPRIKTLAHNLIHYSCRAKKGDKILIHHTGPSTEPLARQLIKEAYAAGAIPFLEYTNPVTEREMLLHCTKEQLMLMAEVDAKRMAAMDCYIAIRGSDNITEYADVPSENLSLYETYYSTPVHHQIRIPKTRWVVLRYPNSAMAQLAGTSRESFEDFYFDVCNLDYSKMAKAMEPLKELMNRTDKVRIIGPGTNLSFSIKGIPAVPCAGEMNIPDGEIFTAPVRDSINGTLTYNTPSVFQGFTFENISFTFENGKIIEAFANDTDRINHVLSVDEGARYIGEFAIGVNPYVTTPMKDTLFDEKIKGSFHMTPGNCYEEAPNGNHSAIHWDLVCIQTADWGGGEIYFDDVLVRKDGIFVLPELENLNPEHLK